MAKIKHFVSQFDWGALIGAVLASIFLYGVVIPLLEKLSSIRGARGNLSLNFPAETWTAIFTGTLTVSTIGLWVVTWATLRHAKKDAVRQERQTRVGNRAAIAAANRILRTERPCIFGESITTKQPGFALVDGSPRLDIECQFRNVGTRPAIARLFAMTFTLDAMPPTLPTAIRDIDFDWGIIGPNGTYRNSISLASDTINELEAENINSGRRLLFVFGYLRYADVHGINRRSGFAYQFNPGTDPQRGTFTKCGPSQYWYDAEEHPIEVEHG